jgi:hypothetical protein
MALQPFTVRPTAGSMASNSTVKPAGMNNDVVYYNSAQCFAGALQATQGFFASLSFMILFQEC